MGVVSAGKKIMIQPDIPQEPILLSGDRIHLQRVFFNLIDNALHHTSPGGKIDVVLRKSDQKAIVLISDNGCGIAGDELPKIFNKFYRVAPKDQEADSGMGLGLSIVYTIITLHGGSISVDSKLGKGTSFTLEFPLINKIPN